MKFERNSRFLNILFFRITYLFSLWTLTITNHTLKIIITYYTFTYCLGTVYYYIIRCQKVFFCTFCHANIIVAEYLSAGIFSRLSIEAFLSIQRLRLNALVNGQCNSIYNRKLTIHYNVRNLDGSFEIPHNRYCHEATSKTAEQTSLN